MARTLGTGKPRIVRALELRNLGKNNIRLYLTKLPNGRVVSVKKLFVMSKNCKIGVLTLLAGGLKKRGRLANG